MRCIGCEKVQKVSRTGFTWKLFQTCPRCWRQISWEEVCQFLNPSLAEYVMRESHRVTKRYKAYSQESGFV